MSAEEILYPPPENIEKVIELVQTLSDQHIDEITPKLLKKHPNTYTFTKALAEHEVANAFSQVPSCIVRPSMILGVWKDPVPGWTNSKNGPQGFIMGASLGVIRRLPVATDLIYDYIPVDIVVSTLIAGAMYTATNKDQLTEIPIFQCTSSTFNPFRWAAIENQIISNLHKFPAMQAVWYPHLKLLPSLTIFHISAFIFHMIPAYFWDTVSRLSGVRPKLVRLHTSVNQSVERLEPFIFQEWKFDNSRTMELHNQLALADRQLFGLDITSLSWKEFFETMAHGVRRWLLNEKDITLPKARRKNYMLMVANMILQFSIFAMLVVLVKSVLGLGGWQASLLVFSLLYLEDLMMAT